MSNSSDGWFLPLDAVNDMQERSIDRLIQRAKHAHYIDVDMRINGQNEHHEADWIKHMRRRGTYNIEPNEADVDAFDLLRFAKQNLKQHAQLTQFANNALVEAAIGWIEAAERLKAR
jgi:hypothetical protein